MCVYHTCPVCRPGFSWEIWGNAFWDVGRAWLKSISACLAKKRTSGTTSPQDNLGGGCGWQRRLVPAHLHSHQKYTKCQKTKPNTHSYLNFFYCVIFDHQFKSRLSTPAHKHLLWFCLSCPPTPPNMASLSSIPAENDRLEPDKEEFQHSGPDTRAGITLHVAVDFWVSTDTTLTLWLRGFGGGGLTIKAYESRECSKQQRSWFSHWSLRSRSVAVCVAYRQNVYILFKPWCLVEVGFVSRSFEVSPTDRRIFFFPLSAVFVRSY